MKGNLGGPMISPNFWEVVDMVEDPRDLPHLPQNIMPPTFPTPTTRTALKDIQGEDRGQRVPLYRIVQLPMEMRRRGGAE